MTWNDITTQQTHNVDTTSLQRRCNVTTLQRRCNDVDATLCVCWESKTNQPKRKCNRNTALEWSIVKMLGLLIGPVYDITYNKICVTSKDWNQPVHPPNMASILVHPSLDWLEAVEGTCDQRRLWWDCVDAQADWSLRWSHKSYCRYCCAQAQFILPLASW